MDYRIRSALFFVLFVGVMVAVGLFLGFNQSIVGGSVAKTVACKDNSDCNDWISATQDICRNPGTISSLCVNKPIR